jgi:hypothetical protein
MASNSSVLPLDTREIEHAASSLKPRRKALLNAILAGNTVARSAQLAGYSAPRAGTEALTEMRKKLPELMESLGMSTADALRELRRKWRAQKTITASHEGQITDILEVDDNGAQLDALKLSLRLHGLLANEETGPSVLNINITGIGVQFNEGHE